MPSIVLLVAAIALWAPADQTHEDSSLGFRIRVPKDWTPVPLPAEEKWIVAKYESDESFRPKTARPFFEAYRPHLFVTRFGPGSGFKDYHDYLERVHGDGFHLVSIERGKTGASPAEKWEFKVEHHDVKRRILAWTFRRDKEWFAVELETLEENYRRYRHSFKKHLETFELIEPTESSGERAGSKKPAESYDLEEFEDRERWRALSAEARVQWRKDLEEWEHRTSLERTPKRGWDTRETPHFLVISEMHPRLTEYYIGLFEAGYSWMEEHFGDLSEEYVRRRVVRLISEEATERVFAGNESTPFQYEHVLYRDIRTGSRTVESCDFVVDAFLEDKLGVVGPVHEVVGHTRPYFAWIDAGFEAIGYADFVSKRLLLHEWDDDLREARREKELLEAQELLTRTSFEFQARGWGPRRRQEAQATALFTAFSECDGKKGPFAGFLCRYLRRAVELLEEYETSEGQKDLGTKGEFDDDERGQEQERIAELKDRERRQRALSNQILEELCSWSRAEWSRVESLLKRKLR